jgi:hypothetical protein
MDHHCRDCRDSRGLPRVPGITMVTIQCLGITVATFRGVLVAFPEFINFLGIFQ